MAKSKIEWTALAIRQFNEAIDYIAGDSFANAQAAQKTILSKLEQCAKHPHSNPPDSNKLDNEGNYRRVLILSYYVSYKINSKSITVLRIRHTKMLPKHY